MPLLDMSIVLDRQTLEPEVVKSMLSNTHPLLPSSLASGWRFSLTSQGKKIDYISRWDHAALWMRNVAQDFADGWRWCEPFAMRKCFRQAYIYDGHYLSCQRMDDPGWFEYNGLPCPDLPRKKNIAGQLVLDISQNPGRWHIRDGYEEAVGAMMWLGRPFWKLTGASKKEVIGQTWLKCHELPNGVLQVQAWPKPFTSAEGEEGEIQNRLRDLLFPKHFAHEKAQAKKEAAGPLFDMNDLAQEINKKLKKAARKTKPGKKGRQRRAGGMLLMVTSKAAKRSKKAKMK
jgi:hypothetical protein